jgi:hypothetical protein
LETTISKPIKPKQMKFTLTNRNKDWCKLNHKLILNDKRTAANLMAMHFDLTLQYAGKIIGIYLNDYNAQINEGKIDKRKESEIVSMDYDRVQRLERPMVKVYPIRTETQGNKIVLTYDSRANY